jgi:hypothetical protein
VLQVNGRSGGSFGDGDGDKRSPVVTACAEVRVAARCRTCPAGEVHTGTRADGSQPAFRLTRVAQFPKAQFPTKLVYGNIDHAGLRLITCGGSFNSQTGHYEDNIVVFADLIATTR